MRDVNLKGKRVAVIGSRTFNDRDRLFKILDRNRDRIKLIVSGGASGADTFAHEWTKERGFPCLLFYPRWKDENGIYNKGAGFRRNYNIIESCDVVLAFWDNVSEGTKNSLEIAERLGRPVKIYEFTPVIPEKVQESPKELESISNSLLDSPKKSLNDSSQEFESEENRPIQETL